MRKLIFFLIEGYSILSSFIIRLWSVIFLKKICHFLHISYSLQNVICPIFPLLGICGYKKGERFGKKGVLFVLATKHLNWSFPFPFPNPGFVFPLRQFA